VDLTEWTSASLFSRSAWAAAARMAALLFVVRTRVRQRNFARKD
jgi:hypothetical protein